MVISLSTFLALVLPAGTAGIALSKNDPTEFVSFEEYLRSYHKSWPESELEHRRAIFNTNVQRVQEHNLLATAPSNGLSYHLGVDAYTDLEAHEVVTGYDKSQRATIFKDEMNQALLEKSLDISLDDPIDELPTHVDWRKIGVTTPVKNQGMCGSCWAFASTSVLESHLAINTNVLTELSVQQLVSCAPNPKSCGGDGGCEGSTSVLAFENVMNHGMVTEWEYGYNSYRQGDEDSCRLETSQKDIEVFSKHEISMEQNLRRRDQDIVNAKHNTTNFYGGAIMGIEGWISLPPNDYVATMNALAKLGPLVVSVACHPWLSYKAGVFPGADFSSPTSKRSDTDVNHMVVLEGYGTDEETGEDYWLVRNSWGPNWGEGGYIRLKRDDAVSCGIDKTPADGIACTKDDNGQKVTPPNAIICGNSGILFDVSLPIGAFLV